MPRTRLTTTDLRPLHRQWDSWRRPQAPRPRRPEPLGAAAATLAPTPGVSAVARLLGLDYYQLKRRVTPAPRPAPSATPPPGFVELQLADALGGGSGSCRIELSDPAGGKRTGLLPGDAPAVLALAQGFWRRGR